MAWFGLRVLGAGGSWMWQMVVDGFSSSELGSVQPQACLHFFKTPLQDVVFYNLSYCPLNN